MLKSTRFDVPTIVVGNLSVGGTGKSPMIEYLIRLLQDNHRVAVLSRGYKRTSKGFQIATKNTTVLEIGDEPMQFFKKFTNIIVAVDAKRVHGIKQLKVLDNPPEVILLDDAFQHRKVQGGFNILLTPYYNLYVDDYMLPSGDLRENIEGAKRADVIIVTKCPSDLKEKEQYKITEKLKIALTQNAYYTKIDYDDFIYSKKNKIKLTNLKDYQIILVTGIAKTSPLTNFLKQEQITFKHLAYKDHYHFTNKDLEKIRAIYTKIVNKKKLILTTEKDYVRTFEFAKDNIYYLPIKTEFLSTIEAGSFNKKIKKYVGQSTRNR